MCVMYHYIVCYVSLYFVLCIIILCVTYHYIVCYVSLYWWGSIDIRKPGIEQQHGVPQLTAARGDYNQEKKKNCEQDNKEDSKLFYSLPKHINIFATNGFSFFFKTCETIDVASLILAA